MKHNIEIKRLIAILVIYNPDLINLKKVMSMHEKNFNSIILVNNSPEISLKTFQSKITSLIYNNKNIGLAAALNIGILEAKKRGADMVALFDQDSMLPNNFCSMMLKSIKAYQGKKSGLYSPYYFNHVTNDYGSFINFKPLHLIRSKPSKRNTVAYPHYVITSGSFIPISVIDDVGLMLEKLFIDFVDIEWCMRARKKGYEIVTFPQIQISHYLGDSSISFLGTYYPIHSPLRMYYYFRNAIYLYHIKDIDLNWRIIDASRNLFRFLFYIMFVKNRLTYLKYIIKGYYHGIKKQMGAYVD